MLQHFFNYHPGPDTIMHFRMKNQKKEIYPLNAATQRGASPNSFKWFGSSPRVASSFTMSVYLEILEYCTWKYLANNNPISYHLLSSFSRSMVCIGGWKTSLYSRGPLALLVWKTQNQNRGIIRYDHSTLFCHPFYSMNGV